MSIIDSHLHLFRSYSEQYPRPIHPGLAEAEREALAADLIKEMDSAGVDKAILVPLGPQDQYVSEVQREYPGKFAAVGIFDPTSDDQEKNLDSRIAESRIQGIRVGHVDHKKNLGDDPRTFEMFPLFKAMAERNLKVWFYAEPPQVRLFTKVLKELPNLVAVFNHCGFMVSLENLCIDEYSRPHFSVTVPPETLDLLEEAAVNPNACIHFSGQYAFTHDLYPHDDIKPVAQRLINIFGPSRMLWASDFPWIKEVPGYAAQLTLVDHLLPELSSEDRAKICGGNAERLFNF
jgi:predicted TIM-barrel fold metal-dependent hydrolase